MWWAGILAMPMAPTEQAALLPEPVAVPPCDVHWEAAWTSVTEPGLVCALLGPATVMLSWVCAVVPLGAMATYTPAAATTGRPVSAHR